MRRRRADQAWARSPLSTATIGFAAATPPATPAPRRCRHHNTQCAAPNTPDPSTRNGIAENFDPTASPAASPNEQAVRQPGLSNQLCNAYSASNTVAAAATSSVANAACPRIGGTVASNSTANRASPSVCVIRRAQSHVANNNNGRKGNVPRRASVRYSS